MYIIFLKNPADIFPHENYDSLVLISEIIMKNTRGKWQGCITLKQGKISAETFIKTYRSIQKLNR